MLSEMIQAISAQAVKAAGLDTRRLDVKKGQTARVETEPGTFVEVYGGAPPRKHSVARLETMGQLAVRHHRESGHAVLWYNVHEVVLVMDDRTREDLAQLKLDFSPQFAKLAEFNARTTRLSQGEVLFLFRTLFKNSLARAEDAYEVLKKLKFKVGQETDAENTRSKVSLGRQIMAEASGVTNIPEYVILSVPVFASKFQANVTVECFLDIDIPGEKVALIPVPGEMERCVAEAEDSIRWRLQSYLSPKANEGDSDYNIPLYCGSL